MVIIITKKRSVRGHEDTGQGAKVKSYPTRSTLYEQSQSRTAKEWNKVNKRDKRTQTALPRRGLITAAI